MIRVAAVGDVHFGRDSAGTMRPHLEHLAEHADALLLAGDLTLTGEPEEARALADELDDLPVPAYAVLGNHDHHAGRADEVCEILASCGVAMIDGEQIRLGAGGSTVGIVGTKGFGGGFAGACATDFGEAEMKAFVRHTKDLADRLDDQLGGLDTDIRVVLLHYAPIPGTLRGERPEIYPFLGSYLLGEAIDRHGADLVLHGHAHAGVEKGATPGGIHVRNVAQTVINQAYKVYSLEPQPAHTRLEARVRG